jgi:hypothetical protein
VLVEGFGAVGGPCALYLARAGMKVVGVADREKVLVAPSGLEAGEVEELVRLREDKCLPAADPRCLRGAERGEFSEIPPISSSPRPHPARSDRSGWSSWPAQGVRRDRLRGQPAVRRGEARRDERAALADSRFSIIPDVVANCGMARAFSYLMQTFRRRRPGRSLPARSTTPSPPRFARSSHA